MAKLSAKERIRYSRQIMLSECDEQKQSQLKCAHVLVVGAGGLGNPALMYLASSGVGNITIMDDDAVELSNLQRQVAFKVNHLGQNKASAMAKVLASLNNEINITPVTVRATRSNLQRYVSQCDVVLDCSDNFATRYAINRCCALLNTPLVIGAATAWQGHVGLFDFTQANSPCYECVFPQTPHNPSDNCNNLGVIAPLLGVIGTQQALLALHYLLGLAPDTKLYTYHAKTLAQKSMLLQQNPECECCALSRNKKAINKD